MSRKQTTFDKVYGNIILELNMGKGGIGNMSGQQQQGTNTSSVPAGVSATPKPGVQMKFSPQTPGAASATTNPQQGQNPAVTQDPKEIQEFTNLLSTRQKNPAQFQKLYQQILSSQDPKRIERIARFFEFAIGQTVK